MDIVDVIIKHDLMVISDEIYVELTYQNKHISIASLPNMQDRTIVINGFSKCYSMTDGDLVMQWCKGYYCSNE